MVRVSVSETYDLSTKTGKMSLVGIHTPRLEIVKKCFGGMLENFRMMRFTKCDVKIACASVLPADPLQVGVADGKIAPQDMFNPILYKAVSNEGMNMFEYRMHGITQGFDDGSRFQGQSIDKSDNVSGSESTDPYEFKMYYSLLANRKGWRVAHPQAGLFMKGLRPYVYEKLYSVADNDKAIYASGSYETPDHVGVIDNYDSSKAPIHYDTKNVTSMRGRPHPMPAFPTGVLNNQEDNKTLAFGGGTADITPADSRNMNIYVGLIVLPPAELNKFYYRLVCRWYIDFFDPRPLNDIAGFGTMVSNYSVHYGSDYLSIASKSENNLGMVDVENGDIEKIMEGS